MHGGKRQLGQVQGETVQVEAVGGGEENLSRERATRQQLGATAQQADSKGC